MLKTSKKIEPVKHNKFIKPIDTKYCKLQGIEPVKHNEYIKPIAHEYYKL